MRVQKKKLKEFKKKELPCFFTPSALEKWNYEYRVETEKKKTKIKWTKKRYIKKKKRYIGWLCEHFIETLTIPKKSYAENWNFEKRKVAVRFYLMTFCAYVDYFIVCYKVETI